MELADTLPFLSTRPLPADLYIKGLPPLGRQAITSSPFVAGIKNGFQGTSPKWFSFCVEPLIKIGAECARGEGPNEREDD